MLARLPKVFGVGEARKAITEMMEEVSRGQTFIIKGPRNREALMIDAETFRNFQSAYMDLVGEIETLRILGDEEAVEALRAVSADEQGDTFTLTEVESMVGRNEGLGGEGAE